VSQHSIIACCRVSVREADIFRLWIQHYRPHVDHLAALILAEGGDKPAGLEKVCRQENVLFDVWRSERFDAVQSMNALQALIRQRRADWVVHADSDEFLREIAHIREIVAELEKQGATMASAWMADRFAFGGRLAPVSGISTVAELEAAFPVRTAVTEKLAKANPNKACIWRWPGVERIHVPKKTHSMGNAPLTLEHFKWRTGLEDRLRKRIGDYAASGLPWGAESQRILDELQRFGRIRVERWLLHARGVAYEDSSIGRKTGAALAVGGSWQESFRAARKQAIAKGLMAANQYDCIAADICARSPCRLLVFGKGYDSELWNCCAGTPVVFLEDDPRYTSLPGGITIPYTYKSKVGEWRDVPEPPSVIAREWDVVIVDGPKGFNKSCPGRQFPIYWAACFARQVIFVHDYDRRWEKELCARYLGEPDDVVHAPHRSDIKLAVYSPALDSQRLTLSHVLGLR